MSPVRDRYWARVAGDQVAAALVDKGGWSPRARGAWLSRRVDFGYRALPRGFSVRLASTSGTNRRYAFAEGHGRPLLIVPGLYGSCEQAFYLQLAERARALGRPVALLEDRLAWPTLRLTRGEVPSLRDMARELGDVAGGFEDPPDVLACEAGGLLAIGAPRAALGRIAAWSPMLDPEMIFARLSRRVLARRRFARRHDDAFARAGHAPPALGALGRSLLADGIPGVGVGPLLLVHARDDPFIPAVSLSAVPDGDGRAVRVVPRGGHLGFGVLAGAGLFLLPFRPDLVAPR